MIRGICRKTKGSRGKRGPPQALRRKGPSRPEGEQRNAKSFQETAPPVVAEVVQDTAPSVYSGRAIHGGNKNPWATKAVLERPPRVNRGGRVFGKGHVLRELRGAGEGRGLGKRVSGAGLVDLCPPSGLDQD